MNLPYILTIVLLFGGCAGLPVARTKPAAQYDMSCKVLNYAADGQSGVIDCGPRGIWVREIRAGDSTSSPTYNPQVPPVEEEPE
jgi:hypothetical protein